MLRDYHTAEDITQDVFIDGYIKLNSLTDYDKIGAWLAKIAKNKCYNYLTREALKYKQERELDDFIPDTRNQTPESYIIHRHEQDNLERAVKNLPEQLKTVTVLFYFKNYTQRKIAEVLNIPEGTVKRRLYDARLNLKKELDNMSENIKNINNINYEEEIAKRIKSLRDYYHLHNFSMDGVQKIVEEFIEFIDSMPESKLKHHAYSVAYGWSDKEEYKSKIEQEIELGENAGAYFDRFWNKYANKSMDDEWLRAIDSEDEGIPKIEKMPDSKNTVGEMLFWRGCCNTRLENYKEARKDFENALTKLNLDNSYHPNAAAGIKAVDILTHESDKYLTGNVGVTGERYRLYDNGKRFDFLNQPGFSTSGIFRNKNNHDSIYYFSAGLKKSRKFFDLNMQENETNGEDTVISKNETVTVAAGTFENCLHIKSVSLDNNNWKDLISETWYAKDAGLIKCLVKCGGMDDEIYELCEYKINGGDGYMPAAVGNIWKYKNINLPDFYEQVIEYEIISVFDEPETGSKYIYMSNVDIIRASNDNCDSEIHIALADKALPSEKPKNWDFETAIKNLKLAVQKNTSVRASLYAANVIEFMERCYDYYKKGWVFLPSTTRGSLIIRNKAEDKIIYKESEVYHLGPYVIWGPWYGARRCINLHPFRFLNTLAGTLYSSKWVAGYSEKIKNEDGEISLKVEDGGTVTTKAGTFENCIKVTFDLEWEGGANDEKYYLHNLRYSHCGTKIYWYAPNVGLVRHDCIWGKALSGSIELTEYKSCATNGEYMPIYVGNKWIYDEMTIGEQFRARRKYNIVSGMEDEFFMHDEQEMVFFGTDSEYEEFQKTREK